MASNIPCLQTERLTLNNIALDDTDDIVNWRSNPEVYKFFLSAHPIKKEEHLKWYNDSYLHDCNRCDWMASDNYNEPIGVFGVKRESIESEEVEISYILNPCKTGLGYAHEAIQKIIEYAVKDWGAKLISAEIHKDNKDSLKFAKNLGMKLYGINGDFCTYVSYVDENKRKIVYIRCDGNNKIGVGHAMRCMAIANQIKGLGKQPIFLVSDRDTEKLITESNYTAICLETEWDNLGKELDTLRRLLAGKEKESILVDSYYATSEYLKELSEFADVTYMDDLGVAKYEVKNLVNYNYYAMDIGYEKKYAEGNVSLYLGPEYTPLRPEFSNKIQRSAHGIKKLLITTGGTDKYNVLDRLLNWVVSSQRELEVFAIIGRFNINRVQLLNKYEEYRNIHILSDVKNMQEYMRNCDLCFTAGGTTLYELCACGTPSLMYVVADNQLQASEKFDETSLIPCLGDVRKDIDSIVKRVDDWVTQYENNDYWEDISRRMMSIVDANGARRIAELL